MNPDTRPDLLDVASFRRDYRFSELRRAGADPDPFGQFHRWLEEAAACPAIVEPNAMALSTCSDQGEVTSRMVLLKGYDRNGLRFFTNMESRKASQIRTNPRVSLLFYWEPLERQIQVNGPVSLLPRDETEAYFASRPRGSRIGAWASRQSEILPDRETLDRRSVELEREYEGKEIPAPPFWSGYLVAAETFEFWQGRSNRLHDRLRYRIKEGTWRIDRLSP